MEGTRGGIARRTLIKINKWRTHRRTERWHDAVTGRTPEKGGLSDGTNRKVFEEECDKFDYNIVDLFLSTNVDTEK